ncbi:MAG: NUDIX hydrolase [Acidimicrobiia bacterium]|jgi:8-oxo-dGTP pyrophosphatase MutT (NUDIX family)
MPPSGGQQRIPRPPSHRPGRPAPWAHVEPTHRHHTLDDIRARLAVLPPGAAPVPAVPGSVAAAVLVPLVDVDGDVSVILTKRPETMPSHKGEIAFPGGKHDPSVDPDLRATALREAHEEIGLDPDAVEIVARLEGISTVASRFVITPFVGFVHGRPALVPDPREVTRVLEVPLSELMGDGVYREERWNGPRFDFDVHFYELTDETVWGATARILTGLLTHLVSSR